VELVVQIFKRRNEMKKDVWNIVMFFLIDLIIFVVVWMAVFEVLEYAKDAIVDQRDKVIMVVSAMITFLVVFIGLESISRYISSKFRVKEKVSTIRNKRGNKND
jgi:tryptophan-rich sensory protein